MEITSAIPFGAVLVESYRAGRFRVGGRTHDGSILILPDRVHAWPVGRGDEITEASLAAVLEATKPPELLLIGCGAQTVLLPAALRQRFRSAGIGLDAMATPAACRTFNVLVSEGRAVAAALVAL